MSAIRRLLERIHRRSLWQVSAVFLATGWGVLQVLDVLTNRGIVPDWTFSAALALLLIGLPVVLATAFVQEGVGGFGRQPTDLPPTSEPTAPAPGRATGELQRTPQERQARLRLAHRRLFTWKNAVLGGLGAFTLLGFASAGYMGMRTFGIGAPGTLLAQGMLQDGAAVVLADFESTTDAELADVVTRTLRVDLLQSRMIRVLDRADLGTALQRMQLERDARITGNLATELAEREGYAAVITGNIASAGSGYVLTASVLGGEGFRQLAGFRETARSEAELVDAIERLSRAIRDKAGESLRSVRSSPALAQVTTTSLEALRAYTRGLAADHAADYAAALPEFERAIELDSTFAMAWRKVATTTANLGNNEPMVRRAATRAWELSDRLPQLERHLAAGFYHQRVSGDLEAAMRAGEQALRLDSTMVTANAMAAANSLGLNLMLLGRYAEAVRVYERMVAIKNAPTAAVGNLVVVRYLAGDTLWLPGLDEAQVRHPEVYGLQRIRVILAASTGDMSAADDALRRLDALGRSAPARTLAHQLRFYLAAQRGRLEEAVRALDGVPAYEVGPSLAYVDLVRGDTTRALQQVRQALATDAADHSRSLGFMLEVALHSGDQRLAAALLQRLDSISPAEDAGLVNQTARQTYRARLASLENRHEVARELLESARRRCPGCGSYASFDLATVYERAGDTERALAAYREMIETWDNHRIEYGYEQPRALRRLAELYEAQGERAKAATYYARFIDLWRDADPDLQPQVRAARERLAQLMPDR
jgi:eukaryotic-like serine/threonine-protein kinase